MFKKDLFWIVLGIILMMMDTLCVLTERYKAAAIIAIITIVISLILAGINLKEP